MVQFVFPCALRDTLAHFAVENFCSGENESGLHRTHLLHPVPKSRDGAERIRSRRPERRTAAAATSTGIRTRPSFACTNRAAKLNPNQAIRQSPKASQENSIFQLRARCSQQKNRRAHRFCQFQQSACRHCHSQRQPNASALSRSQESYSQRRLQRTIHSTQRRHRRRAGRAATLDGTTHRRNPRES